MIHGFLNFFFDYSQMEVKKSEDPFNRFGNNFLEKDFLEQEPGVYNYNTLNLD